MADYSPMMRQYLEMKEKHPNTILFFRLGDFYEMFFNDAKTVSKELEITLTGKDCGQNERAPMCGVPYHSAEGYIAKLVAKGYKVAICEQVEDPKKAKGLVQRDVIRVITPGTILENSMLDENKNNYICSLYFEKMQVGICFADVSTGELQVNQLFAKNKAELEYQIINEMSRYRPSEILFNPQTTDLTGLSDFIRERLDASVECMDFEEYNLSTADIAIQTHFHKTTDELALADKPMILLSLSALITYLKRTQISGTESLQDLHYANQIVMSLDINARRNLELTETMRNKEKRGSLLWVLDKTQTAMGKRLIKTWVEAPLLSPAKITLRQNAVEELYKNMPLLDQIRETLTGVFDLERIMTRIVYGSANGRELRSLAATASKVPALKKIIGNCDSTLLKNLNNQMDSLVDICGLIESAIVEEPPFTIREGGIIKTGYNAELDLVRADMNGGHDLIAGIEANEKAKTGIPKLKIGYNRVFGYYIEVSNSYKNLVPEHYIRKQTISSGERYITQELKDIENRILGAQDRSVKIESELFETVRQTIAGELNRVQATAKAIGVLDVLASFAFISMRYDYTRPVINMSGKLYLKDSRHPVVERLLKDEPFVPNDVNMDMNENRVAIITGPNMAGKSTFMRQVAIITIMAQIGCFVPATVAEIGIIDKIFTRVGASDDLSAGQSTFMIEMSEVADILKNATANSLLIFDEIGRGTSTFDGMSIAKSVLEYVHHKKNVGAKTLFATHYHELTDMESQLSGVKNFNIAVKKRGDDITFLRRIIRGPADDSYGIEVAKLAGVPEKVIKRAKEVLSELENGEMSLSHRSHENRFSDEPVQLTMETADGEVLQKLQSIDVNSLTPIECMNQLFELVSMLK
ncbi:DNA mismatch repair protein MutS [Scatolibacter rhodanostii]|uniref:DNA mismatch repair protein MutS n=1 Tax=Scatolibacter rhodanostii TaxID=2014781 RepID=UPI000C070BB2|nr:DNA mismatch repair protein MutS [Scatolibacter rhodanostii]